MLVYGVHLTVLVSDFVHDLLKALDLEFVLEYFVLDFALLFDLLSILKSFDCSCWT